jgi:hypothetical protein
MLDYQDTGPPPLGRARRARGGAVMRNDHVRAILALRLPDRQTRFLLGLGTFASGEHGWRKAGMSLLAEVAGLSPTTAIKARGELVKAGEVEFTRGKGRTLSTYRVGAYGDHPAALTASVVGGLQEPVDHQPPSVDHQPPSVDHQLGVCRPPPSTPLPAQTSQGLEPGLEPGPKSGPPGPGERELREHLTAEGSPGTETDFFIAEAKATAEAAGHDPDADMLAIAHTKAVLAKLRANGKRAPGSTPERLGLDLAPPEKTE